MSNNATFKDKTEIHYKYVSMIFLQYRNCTTIKSRYLGWCWVFAACVPTL